MKTPALEARQGRQLRSIHWDRLAQLAATSRTGFVAITTGLVLFGVIRLVQATPYGPGLNGDSFYYYTGAENLAAGRGFGRIAGSGLFVPTTHFPPGYSGAMAFLQLMGIDKLDSGNLVNLLSLAGLVLVLAFALRRESGSNIPAYAACAILVVSPVMLESYVWAMSEPFYLLLSFAGLYGLVLYLRNRRPELLVASAALLGLAWITRYVGVALVGTALAALMVQRVPWRKRLISVGMFAAISCLPMLVWLGRNALLTGNPANRRLLWHPIGYSQLKAFALHGLEWFVPAELVHGGWQALAMILVIAVLVGVFVFRLAKRGQLSARFRRTTLPVVLVLHGVLYLAALAVSISLLDPATQIGGRILLPIYVSVIILGGLLGWDIWRHQGWIVRLGILSAGMFILIWNGVEQAQQAISIGEYGLGNAAPSIAESQTLAAVEELADVPIASNGMARLYFWADRNAYAIPWRVDLETGEPRISYADEVRNLKDVLCRDGGALVLFGPENLLSEQAALSDLTAGFTRSGKYSDGEIYRCEGP
ncbi:MAG TPA: glycosyltransferase family 39 protein [Anaerolineales bacterium]|nr:glycosyltransferase family 39 protein [Anaerolineales bacterium]